MSENRPRRLFFAPRRLSTLLLPGVLAAGAGVAWAAEAERDADPLLSHGDAPIATLLEDLGRDVRVYNEHITTLANPFFEGRAPGTRGVEIAAEYLEFYFERFGLEPAFPETSTAADGSEVKTPFSSFRQPFQRGSTNTVGQQSLVFQADGREHVMQPGQHYNVLGFSDGGEASGPLVFVGYGIDASEEHGYSSFSDDESLEGKVALLLRFEPMDEDGRSRFTGDRWSSHAALAPKISAVAARGAAAIVLVNPPGADDPRLGRLEDVNTFNRARGVDVPVVMMTPDAVDHVLAASGDDEATDLLTLQRWADEHGGTREIRGAEVEVSARVESTPIMTDNVGAVLRGRGALADEYIVIGAHYDHLGYGYFGSRAGAAGRGVIHPGADDNASGTAGVLVLAERLAEWYEDLPEEIDARSILFIGFSAEESGLHGSRYYVRNAIASASDHYMMINLDMIGRMRDDTVTLQGTGTAETMEEIIAPYIEQSDLNVRQRPGGRGPSDHASFYAASVPVLFFFTGLHPEYHRPEDVSWRINRTGAVRVINLVSGITMEMATRQEPLEFTSTSRRREEPRAERDEPRDAAPGPMNLRVRFGIAPDNYGQEGGGVLVGQVFEGTSADEAGLQPGDVLVGWNGKEVADVEGWMPLLAEHAPGDEVTITFMRDGERKTGTCTLQPARRGGD